MDLKLLCLNIHKGIGWGQHRLALKELHAQIDILDPDIILLQEILGSQFEILASEIRPHYRYGKNVTYSIDNYGNAIFSKYPITFSDNIDLTIRRYERRGLLHTNINLLENNLHLLCVHLGLLKSDRHRQLDKIIKYVHANITEKDLLIFGGDFNDWSGAATKPLIKQLGLEEAFLAYQGRYARTFPAWAPLLRLDRIYYRGFQTVLAQRLIQKPWRYLSDHIGLEVHLNLIKSLYE